MKNIDINKFNKAMDQLVESYADDKKVTEFERKVGASVCRAAELAMSDFKLNSNQPKFRVVSAPTGGSKTSSSIALLSLLANENKGFSGAYICKTIEECDEHYRTLKKLVDNDQLAVFNSLHKTNASPSLMLEKKRELGLEIEDHFDPKDLNNSRLIITTHTRWMKEEEYQTDLGVRKYKGIHRDLIVVDEEPDLFSIYPCQPHEVGELADLLSGSLNLQNDELKNKVLIHRFTKTLRKIQERMEKITDGAIREATYIPVDLVEEDEYEDVFKLTNQHIRMCLDKMSLNKNNYPNDRLNNILSFIQASAEGMGFHTRQGTSGFYAYKGSMSAESGTLVLDGSADLNGVYGLCKGMELVDVPTVDYRNVKLTHVTPREEFRNKMRPNHILRNAWSARPYMEWLQEYVTSVTPENAEILVVAKKDLLNYGLHKDQSDTYDSPFEADWNNRHVHFCNYGRGRGSNKWKNCKYVFLLGDWHLKTSSVIARIGSLKSSPASGLNLNKLGAARSKDPLVNIIRESHLLTTFKQMSARISLREIDDSGIASPAHVYSIDGDLPLLFSSKDKMFPNSPEVKIIGKDQVLEAATATQKLANLLVTSCSYYITNEELKETCGLNPNMIAKAFNSRLVKAIARAKGWERKKSIEVLGYGRGFVLVNETLSNQEGTSISFSIMGDLNRKVVIK